MRDDSEKISVRLNRDSVHPGDDLESHAAEIEVAASSTVIDLLDAVRRLNYLPGIAGGEATWIIDCARAPNGSLGVLAQQWSVPKLTVPEELSVAEITLGGKAGLYFQYWCQSDPEKVYSCVRAGKEPPNKYR